MDLAFDETETLPAFVVRIIDIDQELAAHVIGDINACGDLKGVVCLYHGNYQTGTAEFIINAPMSNPCCYVSDEFPNLTKYVEHSYNKDCRIIITTLCAALSQSINMRTTDTERNSQFRSETIDNMFSFAAFNCISSRFRMIDFCRSHMTDFVSGARCGVCPFASKDDITIELGGGIVHNYCHAVDRCHLDSETSEKLNHILGALTRDNANTIRFMSRSRTPGLGMFVTKSLAFNNLINILDLEQFLAVKGLLK